jgi:hypothetical protein
MLPILSLLLVVALSLVLTRIATVALVHTGLGRESARFQARSAFTGVGFTTREAEDVVGHPVRRRIVMWLMLVGNVGIVTAVSTLLLSLSGLEGEAVGPPLLALGVGMGALVFLGSSAWVDRHLCVAISGALRRFTDLDARDYARLLHLREDYGVCELQVAAGDWLEGRSLEQAGVAREGLLVLGIECPGGQFVGAPAPGVEIRAGDRLLLYGRTPRIAEIDRRAPGSDGASAHASAVAEQEQVAAAERSAAAR